MTVEKIEDLPSIETITLKIAQEVDGGTAESIENILEKNFDLDLMSLPMEYLYAIDRTALYCTVCGWTQPSESFSENENSAEDICDDCVREIEE